MIRRRGKAGPWLLYLPASYLVAYLLHLPVHGGPGNALIPAAVPWAIAAITAGIGFARVWPLRWSWVVLIAASAFFLAPHFFPHG